MIEIEKVNIPEGQDDDAAKIKEWGKKEAKSLKLRARHMQKKILAEINKLKSYVNCVGSPSSVCLEFYIEESLSLQLEVKHMLSSLQRIEKCLELPIGTYSGELQGAAEALYWKDIDEYDAALKLLSELETRYYFDVRNAIIVGKKPEHPSPEPSKIVEYKDEHIATEMGMGNE